MKINICTIKKFYIAMISKRQAEHGQRASVKWLYPMSFETLSE